MRIGKLDIVPRLAGAAELHLVHRAPIARVADEPTRQREELVHDVERFTVASGVRQRLGLVEERVGISRDHSKRTVEEIDCLVKLLQRRVVDSQGVRHRRPSIAPGVRLQEVVHRRLDLASERQAEADEIVDFNEARVLFKQSFERASVDLAPAGRGLHGDERCLAPRGHKRQPLLDGVLDGGHVRTVERQPQICG